MVGMSAARDLGDVESQRTHAVDVGDDLDPADDRAEVAGDRCLQGEEGERPLLADGAELGDLVVLADHLLGEGKICLEQRLGGALHGDPRKPRHLTEQVGKLGHLFVVSHAHEVTAYGARETKSRSHGERGGVNDATRRALIRRTCRLRSQPQGPRGGFPRPRAGRFARPTY